jgi:hypothetical protein
VLGALEQAIHARRPGPDDGLVHHNDMGVQGGFNRHRNTGFILLSEEQVESFCCERRAVIGWPATCCQPSGNQNVDAWLIAYKSGG